MTDAPLRRSLFFVPGGEERKLEKARTVGADTLLLDLEDSVAPAEKDRARELVAAFLREGEFGGAEPAVRVNPAGTPYFEEDLAAAVSAGAAAIMLPKCERPELLAGVDAALRASEAERAGGAEVALLALVETAAGIVDAARLADASPRLGALCFGHADFSRDMGLAAPSADHGVVLHARCSVAVAARASGTTPIDTVYLDVRDDDGFRRDAELARSLGFDGKLCIHPRQIGLVHEVFTPSPEEIGYARRVVEAARRAEREGVGVFTVDGKMVDAPVVAAQERVLERARPAGVSGGDDE